MLSRSSPGGLGSAEGCEFFPLSLSLSCNFRRSLFHQPRHDDEFDLFFFQKHALFDAFRLRLHVPTTATIPSLSFLTTRISISSTTIQKLKKKKTDDVGLGKPRLGALDDVGVDVGGSRADFCCCWPPHRRRCCRRDRVDGRAPPPRQPLPGTRISPPQQEERTRARCWTGTVV